MVHLTRVTSRASFMYRLLVQIPGCAHKLYPFPQLYAAYDKCIRYLKKCKKKFCGDNLCLSNVILLISTKICPVPSTRTSMTYKQRLQHNHSCFPLKMRLAHTQGSTSNTAPSSEYLALPHIKYFNMSASGFLIRILFPKQMEGEPNVQMEMLWGPNSDRWGSNCAVALQGTHLWPSHTVPQP